MNVYIRIVDISDQQNPGFNRLSGKSLRPFHCPLEQGVIADKNWIRHDWKQPIPYQ